MARRRVRIVEQGRVSKERLSIMMSPEIGSMRRRRVERRVDLPLDGEERG
jgi:hypothetical protein